MTLRQSYYPISQNKEKYPKTNNNPTYQRQY